MTNPSQASRNTGWAAVALIAALVGVSGCAYLLRQRIYLPDPLPAQAAVWPGRAPQLVSVTTSDGLALEGYYWPPSAPGRDVIVFFHGNAGNAAVAARRAEPLARDGRGLLVASYRGYGANPGRPSREGLLRDASAFVAEVRSLAPGSPLILFGYSLGAAVALEIAPVEKPRLVVTLGAFARITDLAPWPVRGVLPDRFDNLAALRRVTAPVLILHGTHDEVAPFAHAARLLAAAPPGSRMIPLQGADHHPDLAVIAERLSAVFDAASLDQAP